MTFEHLRDHPASPEQGQQARGALISMAEWLWGTSPSKTLNEVRMEVEKALAVRIPMAQEERQALNRPREL